MHLPDRKFRICYSKVQCYALFLYGRHHLEQKKFLNFNEYTFVNTLQWRKHELKFQLFYLQDNFKNCIFPLWFLKYKNIN